MGTEGGRSSFLQGDLQSFVLSSHHLYIWATLTGFRYMYNTYVIQIILQQEVWKLRGDEGTEKKLWKTGRGEDMYEILKLINIKTEMIVWVHLVDILSVETLK